MNTNTVKVSDLIGPALDYACAVCEGYSNWSDGGFEMFENQPTWIDLRHFLYSSDWEMGGPIIEREIVSLDAENGKSRWKACAWRSDLDLQSAVGPTPLIAAMRCYVASRLGDTIELPSELIP